MRSPLVDSDQPRQVSPAVGHRPDFVVVSNRGPVEYAIDKGGTLSGHRSSGGLVTALDALAEESGFAWVAGAITEGDRRVALQSPHGTRPLGGACLLRFATIPQDIYDQYYNLFCNRVLWLLQHDLWQLLKLHNVASAISRTWAAAYVPANAAFAIAAVKVASRTHLPPVFMLQDYHLYLVPRYIRQQVPDALIQHFTHIPWPAPSKWLVLPQPIRATICRALLDADIVGFQTETSVENFLACCRHFLPETRINMASSTVEQGGRVTRVSAYPISIDVLGLRRANASPSVEHYRRALIPSCGRPTIVRVDRLDPAKNIVRGFEAFDLMLERHPELREEAKFLAFLVPSRGNVPEYRDYAAEVMRVIESINNKWGNAHGGPIELRYENNYQQAIAGMSLADVVMVNSVADGMNLVAKEAPTVNMNDAPIVLSSTAGAWLELSNGAIPVPPLDVEATAEALYLASTMPPEERKRRASLIRRAVENHDVHDWLAEQIEDLRSLAEYSWHGKRWFPVDDEAQQLPTQALEPQGLY